MVPQSLSEKIMESKLNPGSVKELKSTIDFCNDYHLNLLGYKPEQIGLRIFSDGEWGSFCERIGLNSNSSGAYLPRNQTAFLDGNNHLSLFHEYFGHGLYCEQNLTGRKLIELEKRLLEEERREFQNREFTLEELGEFRKQSENFQNLDEHRRENRIKYELFAIWTEWLLSSEMGLKEKFERRYYGFSSEDRQVIDRVINFSEGNGELAGFYNQGMARRTTAKRVKRLLQDIYKDKLKDVRFVLFYGSRKEFSDIDVFIVGENPQESHSDFLDVKMQSPRDLKKGIKNFDVRTLIPLMNGQFIFGDRDYFEKSKQQILSQPISEEAVKHNLKWSFRMQRLKDENLEDDFLRNKFEGYSQTYLANGLALKQGLKLFTKEDLLSYSHSEKTIQLKGGTEKNAN